MVYNVLNNTVSASVSKLFLVYYPLTNRFFALFSVTYFYYLKNFPNRDIFAYNILPTFSLYDCLLLIF